eukprot:TRINITY_DN1398_c0_g1_i1.p1 TRINITY_DN1398_c0_g1~~TRINITY_DN1398_c0_g1_i1.p1  ORF type:complete len:101 (+),score=24.90 TRINITY_DN1398_c0_g1_i1:29-304(+)
MCIRDRYQGLHCWFPFNYKSIFEEDASCPYGFHYFSDQDGSCLGFQLEDIPYAVKFVQQLSVETGYSKSMCLKLLHSTQWNYAKAKIDLLN